MAMARIFPPACVERNGLTRCVLHKNNTPADIQTIRKQGKRMSS